MNQFIQFSTYSPAADIVVSALCLVMFVLITFSYISRTRSFKLFLTMVGLVFFAAVTDITFYTIALQPEHQTPANWLRCIHHAALLLIFVYYIAYICEVTHYERQRLFLFLANLVFVIVMMADIIVTAQGMTFFADDKGIRFIRHGIFIYGYLGYLILCLILMAYVRKHLFRRIMFGFYGTIAVSVTILFLQGFFNQSSYTVATLLFPMIAMMYILHSNPYDALIGSNDMDSMQDFVRYCYEKRQEFIFMSLYLKEFDSEGKELSLKIQAHIRQFTSMSAKNSRLFKVGKGHVIMMFLKKNYPDHEQKIDQILEAFYPLYKKFQYDYKIVVGWSTDEISKRNEYVSYIRNIHRTMPECSVHKVNTEDLIEFNRNEIILKELADIFRCNDLDDPRILAYCQPVLDVSTGKYDTAESLMRLDLGEEGIIDPHQFISLAEEQGYIHMLTRIILHKTCDAIRQFIDEGYDIKRISVNVSVPELKAENFCDDIIGIIHKSGIPGDKIAIELTESQNEGDFMLMKQKIEILKAEGIKFYLDDFGTGFSSIERILALPFDIIKFDRSLLVASGEGNRSRKMVSNLANMFADMDYYVLYEGVEKDSDESMCRDMSAAYLQGFKYSKPTPIMELKEYLSKK